MEKTIDERETLIKNIDNAMNAAVYVMSDYVDRAEADYLIRLIERDIENAD